MKMWTEMTSAVLLSACIIFSGCSDSDWSTDPPSPEKIAATNKVREQLGIRQIKDNWTFYGRSYASESWKDNRKEPCKNVQHDKKYEKILWEQDIYYTGRSFLSPDRDSGPESEFLVLYYDFRIKRFNLAVVTDNRDIMALEETLHETTPRGGLGYMGRTDDETLEVADKILKMWNMERL